MDRLTVDGPITAEQAERIQAAWDDYVAKVRHLAGVQPCTSPWPADPPGPGYLGTRCELEAGHTGQHRHRIAGTRTVVTW